MTHIYPITHVIGVDTRENRLQLYQRQFSSSNRDNDDSDDDVHSAQMRRQKPRSGGYGDDVGAANDETGSSGPGGLRAMLGPFVPPSPHMKPPSPDTHAAAGGGNGEHEVYSLAGTDDVSAGQDYGEAFTSGPPRLKGYAKPVTGYIYERICEKHREFQNPKPKAVRDALAAKAEAAAAAAAAASAAAAAFQKSNGGATSGKSKPPSPTSSRRNDVGQTIPLVPILRQDSGDGDVEDNDNDEEDGQASPKSSPSSSSSSSSSGSSNDDDDDNDAKRKQKQEMRAASAAGPRDDDGSSSSDSDSDVDSPSDSEEHEMHPERPGRTRGEWCTHKRQKAFFLYFSMHTSISCIL